MKETINYKLKKPDYENVADIGDINYNMDVIDKTLKVIEGKADNINWDSLKNKPSVFNPSSHRHHVTDIDNLTNTIVSTKVNNAAYSDRAGVSDNADRLIGKNWYWQGQDGQPAWLWGGSDGINMYVYHPRNFSVNYANSCNQANNTNNVQGFQFRNNGGKLEVLIGGVWLSVGGQIYNRFLSTNNISNRTVADPLGEAREGIQNQYYEGQEILIFEWRKPSKILNLDCINRNVSSSMGYTYMGIIISNVKVYLDDILVYDSGSLYGGSEFKIFNTSGNTSEWHNRYIEVRKGFKVVGKISKNNIGSYHPFFSIEALYYEG